MLDSLRNKLWHRYIMTFGPHKECNICGHVFRGYFEPLPAMYEELTRKYGYPYSFDDAETLNYKEYLCPKCNCNDRDRLYALYLRKTLSADRKYKVLDIAPAKELKNWLKKQPQIEYRSADLFMEDVDDKVDLMNMVTYEDDRFDAFICSHVLEHVPDDRKAMRELRRVLRPGGFGICMVPIVLSLKEIDEDVTITDPGERWRRFGQDDHVRLYSKQSFIDRLREAGFTVSELTIKDFEKGAFERFGISKKSVLYIVSK